LERRHLVVWRIPRHARETSGDDRDRGESLIVVAAAVTGGRTWLLESAAVTAADTTH